MRSPPRRRRDPDPMQPESCGPSPWHAASASCRRESWRRQDGQPHRRDQAGGAHRDARCRAASRRRISVGNGGVRALPIGARWDAASGTFAWQPAPGFLGRYRIVFSNGAERISVRVVVVAQ